MAENPDEAAERIGRKTQRILWASGIGFAGWQVAYFVLYAGMEPRHRTVDKVTAVAFLAWCAALLFLLATGGGAFAGRETREIIDDELARAQRASAYRNAFWAMMGIGFAGYVLAQFTAVTSLHLAHATMSAGILVAVLTLALLGRR